MTTQTLPAETMTREEHAALLVDQLGIDYDAVAAARDDEDEGQALSWALDGNALWLGPHRAWEMTAANHHRLPEMLAALVELGIMGPEERAALPV